MTGAISDHPSPDAIRTAAASCGLIERRSECSATLFFWSEAQACEYNVFYTTRSLMTRLTHPSRGKTMLFRSGAYDTIADLIGIFNNPRSHTGLGYRRRENAIRGCVECGLQKARKEFSLNQWKRGPDGNRCKECVAAGALHPISIAMGNVKLEESSPDPAASVKQEVNDGRWHQPSMLTKENLSKLQGETEKLERRQFNCPRHGVFFKKVPAKKPVASCPQCKRINGTNTNRWVAVPRKDEKGFGLFRCGICRATWGSSKACRSLGQFCASEDCEKIDTPVYPFKILPEKKRPRRGGGAARPRPAPMETLPEPEPVYHGYGGAGYGGSGYGQQGEAGQVKKEEDDPVEVGDVFGCPEEVKTEPGKPMKRSTPRHRCTGCDQGLCNDRVVPVSQAHDSTGSTASTCSEKTWSTMSDFDDFADRDAE